MLRTIKEFITGRRADPAATVQSAPPAQIHLAAAALLVQLAYADGEFTAAERTHVAASLSRHFSLEPNAIEELLSLAERERGQAIDDFQFTRVINEHFDLGQKLLLAEIMWGVALADGQVGDQESTLFRKLGHLLDLQPGYLAEARRAAAGPETLAAKLRK